MKKLMLKLSAVILIAFSSSCSDSKERYVDLSTGKGIEIVKDEKTGLMVNKETGEPLYIYVDTQKNDTIYAKTGKVINGHVILDGNKKYIFDEDQSASVKYNDNDYKRKVENDGDVKIKSGDQKIKIDGETGEKKVKND